MNFALQRLEASFSDTSGVYVNAGIDEKSYFDSLIDDIRSHEHEPFEVTAKVVAPGFPDEMNLGEDIKGLCVAHRGGYWLVYQPKEDIFYCFWGNDPHHLEAPGIFGGALYCWSA